MTLFDHRRKAQKIEEGPLAARMRPRSFDEFVGQQHLLAPGQVLRSSIEQDHIPSMILWGPPGIGKTTLAFLISRATHSHFSPISAVASGVADLRAIVEQARARLEMHDQQSILFVDEIHRFNRGQQDAILPFVEDGTITLIGATTENPSFEIIAPLLSRCHVFCLEPLSNEQLLLIVKGALSDQQRGFGQSQIEIDSQALEALVTTAHGDGRIVLNTLEFVVATTQPNLDGVTRITVQSVMAALQQPIPFHDKHGDQHYNIISAFIKSIRGSNPNAALYWLARMILAGEDPLFITRRLIIAAAEDIGMADPMALSVAITCQQAVHFIGMPEGRIPLAQATVYLATAPKSNSAYVALNRALEDAQRTLAEPIPLHLRNAVTSLGEEMQYGKDYKYPYDYENNFVRQEFFPNSLMGKSYYEPSNQGYEIYVVERLAGWRNDNDGTRHNQEKPES